jgi:hypothetical protein
LAVGDWSEEGEKEPSDLIASRLRAAALFIEKWLLVER